MLEMIRRYSIFSKWALLVCLMAVTLLSPSAAMAQQSLGAKVNGLKLLDEAYEWTNRRFYDKRILRRKNWPQIRKKYVARAKRATIREEVYEIINEMLGELKTSHLALVDGTVADRHLMGEFRDQAVPQLGVEFIAYGRKLFVGGMLEGGAADKAGLKAGDRVVKINGLPAIDCDRLREGGHDPGLPGQPGYVMLVKKDEEVRLEIQRTRKGPMKTVVLKTTQTNMIRSVARSARTMTVEGRKIGVIHTWHFMSSRISEIVRKALIRDFSDCDGLVLDIRGRGGSTRVVSQLLNMFIGRRRIWSKPVVVLQDNHTRSAKEIFALKWKQARRGPVIGQTSQGACIGTQFQRLSDGSILLLPAIGVTRLTNGIEIEGVGVKPTIFVEPGPLPYRNGRDKIFEKGVSVLTKLVKAEQRPRKAQPRRDGARLY